MRFRIDRGASIQRIFVPRRSGYTQYESSAPAMHAATSSGVMPHRSACSREKSRSPLAIWQIIIEVGTVHVDRWILVIRVAMTVTARFDAAHLASLKPADFVVAVLNGMSTEVEHCAEQSMGLVERDILISRDEHGDSPADGEFLQCDWGLLEQTNPG